MHNPSSQVTLSVSRPIFPQAKEVTRLPLPSVVPRSTLPPLPPVMSRPALPQVPVRSPVLPQVIPRPTLPQVPVRSPVLPPVIPRPSLPQVPMMPRPTIPQVPMMPRPTIPQVPARSPPVIPRPTIPQLPVRSPPIIPIPALPQLPAKSSPTLVKHTFTIPRFSDAPKVPTIPPRINIPLPSPNDQRQPFIGMNISGRPLIAKKEPKLPSLYDWQKPWAERSATILHNYGGFIDTSKMRSGKSIMMIYHAIKMKLPLFIICPITPISSWKKEIETYGVEVIDIISYASLRSKQGFQPKHGYLDRYDWVDEDGFRKIVFKPTKKYMDILERGAIVVLDEFQNAKNNSAQNKACTALLAPIANREVPSYYAILSGTPFDKVEHSINICKMLGFIEDEKLQTYEKDGKRQMDGLDKLFAVARQFDEEMTNYLIKHNIPGKGMIAALVNNIFVEVIEPVLAGSMVPPDEIANNSLHDLKNGFYMISESQAAELKAAMEELIAASGYDKETGQLRKASYNAGGVNRAMANGEYAKSYDFSRVAHQILENDPNEKVIISVNYKATIKAISTYLVHYNPLILQGSVPEKKRAGIISTFNENPNYRVLIMNSVVGQAGISLYQKNVNSPRTILISPSYLLTVLTQVAARIFGPGMIAKANVRMFYMEQMGNIEQKIMTAIAEKSGVLHNTLVGDSKNATLLPNQYPNIYEADGYL